MVIFQIGQSIFQGPKNLERRLQGFFLAGTRLNQPPNRMHLYLGYITMGPQNQYFRGFLYVFMVHNLVSRWPKPLFLMVLGAHGIYNYKILYVYH